MASIYGAGCVFGMCDHYVFKFVFNVEDQFPFLVSGDSVLSVHITCEPCMTVTFAYRLLRSF